MVFFSLFFSGGFMFKTPSVVIGGAATAMSFFFGFYCIESGVDLISAAAFVAPILGNTAVFIHGAMKQ